jgi:hypothetical protein
MRSSWVSGELAVYSTALYRRLNVPEREIIVSHLFNKVRDGKLIFFVLDLFPNCVYDGQLVTSPVSRTLVRWSFTGYSS